MAVHLRLRPAPSAAPRRRDPAAAAAAVGAGALVAASLPPWGWWPLAFVGIAILDRLVADRPARSRFVRTWLFGVAWLAPGMGWMWFLTAPGYVVAVAAYSGYLGLAAAIAPGGRWRRLALPAALTVAEAIRFVFPFGGVPLASLGISQAYSPAQPDRPPRRRDPHHLAHVHGRQRALGRVGAVVAPGHRPRRDPGGADRPGDGRPVRSRQRADPHGRPRPGRRSAGHARRRHGPAGRVRPPPVRHPRHRPTGRPRRLARERHRRERRRVRRQPGAGRGRGGGQPAAGAHRGRRDRGRRRALHQRPDPGHARRAAGQSLRQGAAGALRRVHAAAGPAEGARGADLPGPPRRAAGHRSPRCSTCRPATGSR